MKIISLDFEDKALGWHLKHADFTELTLLVGASGVGKTKILRSIMKLKSVANGKSASGIRWKLIFQTLDKTRFEWEGEFENKGEMGVRDNDDGIQSEQSSILYERLLADGQEVVARDNNEILLKGERIVRLPSQQSIVHLLKEEELVRPAFEGMLKIEFSDHTDSANESYRLRIADTQKLLKRHPDLASIRQSKLDVLIRLYLAYMNDRAAFVTIKQRYTDIFPQVEDIRVEPWDWDDADVPLVLKEYPFVQIKEKGVDKWIRQDDISSGMFRSLIHLADISLSDEGTVFLIDEFENSLGVNCINELTSEILSSHRQLQFILTSHHPYIINNIDYKYWKLVTRSKGEVHTQSAEHYRIGNSKHDAFMQLMQLEQFQTGME